MPHSDMGVPPSIWSFMCLFNLFTMKDSDGFYIRKGDIIFDPAPVVPKGSNVSVICRRNVDPCKGTGHFVFDIDGIYRNPHWMNQTFSSVQLPGVRGHHHIICYMECGLKHTIMETSLEVGYPPDKPSNISCSVGALSSEMTCTWDTGQETELATSYDVRVVNLQTGETSIEQKSVSSVQITVNRTRDEMFHIQVTARNQLNYSASDVVLVNLSDIVVPITPIISEIQLLQSTFNISISWRKQTSESLSYCEVKYKSLTDPSWRTIGQTANINSSLVITKTPTADFLRVRCREETGNSYWSNWSTPLHLPPSAPVGAPNVWRILGPEYPNRTREVTILIMKDIDETPQRPISGYKVFYMDEENATTLRTCALSELECVTLVPEGVKMVFVSAFNSYGNSPKSLVSPQEESGLPEPRNVTATSRPMEVRWESPASAGQPLLWYVLQWNPDACGGRNGNVSWQKLLKNTTRFLFNDTVFMEQRGTILLYAVYSSGVSRPDTVEFKPESGPDSITIERILPNTLIIQWSEVPPCKRRGFITTYTLNVTEQSSRVLYTHYLDSEARRFTFKEYYPDRRYSVCISASTKAGEGPNSCAFIEPDASLQNYFGPLLGTCLGAITLTAIILALSMIRKRIKSTLRLWLPKYLHEEYPNVRNSVAVKFLQEKQEDLGSFLNPSYNDPEITDVQEALKYATIISETPEAHPLLKTTTDANMVEHMAEASLSLQTIADNMTEHLSGYRPTDQNMVEHTIKVGPPLQMTTDKLMEHISSYRPTDQSMVVHMAKVDPTLQIITDNLMEHMSSYRPTDQSMVVHMAKVDPTLQTTNEHMTDHISGYRPQLSQPNLHIPDEYCSPFHLLNIHRETLGLESSPDGLDINDSCHIDFSLFQGMDLQVLHDGAPEDDPASMHGTAWGEHQKCSEITGMGDILSGQLIIHLDQDINPYFPQIYARGT